MATVVSTSPHAPLTSTGRHLDRCADGTLWTWVASTADNGSKALFQYSKDNGATWTYAGVGMDITTTNLRLFVDSNDVMHVFYNKPANGSWYRRGAPNASRTSYTWLGDVQVSGSESVGDLVAFVDPTDSATTHAWVLSAGLLTHFTSTTQSITKDAATLSLGGVTYYGHSMDFHHTGDGKTVKGGTPHLYLSYSTDGGSANASIVGCRFRHVTFSGGAWTLNTERTLDTARYYGTTADTWAVSMYDGTRHVVAGWVLEGNFGSGRYLAVWDITSPGATSATKTYELSTGTTGDAMFGGTASYDRDGNVYVWGRAGSGANGTRPINWRKWTRSGSTLSAITTVESTGRDQPYITAKRGWSPTNVMEVVYTRGTAAPYSLVYDLSVTLNLAPYAPILTSPVGGATVDRTATQRLSWTFSDPDPGDTQSAYELRYRLVGAGAWTSVAKTATPNTYHDVAAGTFAAGSSEWQVLTYDASGVAGPWSASEFFTAATPPTAPSITDPVNGQTLAAATYTVVWSYPTQQAYQLRRVADAAGSADTATVYFDTGTVENASARSRAVAFDVNSRFEHVQVRVRDAGLWSPWASVRVQVSFTPPTTPTVAALGDNATGSITVAVTNPAPGVGVPVVTSNDVWRREGASGDGIRVAAGLAANATWVDWTPASGVVYQYRAVATGDNGTTATSAWVA